MLEGERLTSFGQTGSLTWVDRYGVWLSARQIRRHAGSFRGRRIADLGCGYQAPLARAVAAEGAASVLAVDVALSQEARSTPRLECLEGRLPGVLAAIPDASLDMVLCVSVLEHVWDAPELLAGMHRILAADGLLLVNVPSWRGKRFLEFSAFRLGLSPAEEMDDHKIYYDPRDLWPLLVRAGFRPRRIRCFAHKFGLNTFAICRKG